MIYPAAATDQGTIALSQQDTEPSSPAGEDQPGALRAVVTLTLALRSPAATVWALDTNERARALTTRNSRRAGADNVRVCAPHEVPADVRFDTIWSNPPIRIGKAALRELLSGWLGRLTDEGTAVLVVQKHLGADSLHRWLDDQGFATTRRASRAGFRLLECSARAARTDGPQQPDPA